MPRKKLIAWEIYPSSGMPLEPAPMGRAWMDCTDQGYAYRCLPLLLANQAGWVLRSPVAFSTRWNGGKAFRDLRIWFRKNKKDQRICSHFGDGILTIGIPYLFRTPPGINLWVKGPANAPKDGIQPLEGIVETDWSEYTFTMNWQLTRPHHLVRFEEGEPICLIVPVARGLAEGLDSVLKPMGQNAKLARAYRSWKQARLDFNEALKRQDDDAVKEGWQRAYFQGRNSEGIVFAEHQTRMHLHPFRRES